MKTIYYPLILLLLSCHVGADAFVYLSNTAKFICEGSEGYGYEARFRLIRTLDNNISMTDIEYYLNFLDRSFKKGDLRVGEFNTLKNDLADKLLMQRILPREMAKRFLGMTDQKALGVVWRDYVLQKLPDLYERVEEVDRVLILDKLWGAADSTEHTFSGTALLGLDRIGSKYAEMVDSDRFAEQALLIVKEAEFPEQNKITALQLLAESGHPEALDLARKILNTESTVMLRVSAIGVLGSLGQSVDRETLSVYTKDSEFRLRHAAQCALERLDG